MSGAIGASTAGGGGLHTAAAVHAKMVESYRVNFTPGCSETRHHLSHTHQRRDGSRRCRGWMFFLFFFSASSLSHKVNTVKKKKKKQSGAANAARVQRSGSTLAVRPSVSLNGSGRWKCLAFLCEPLSDRLAAALRATVTQGNTTPGTTTVYSVRSFMYKYSVHIYICHLRETTMRFQKKKTYKHF